ncbi:hypothetical protein WN943_004945 [Citrus x changshan-huyou]
MRVLNVDAFSTKFEFFQTQEAYLPKVYPSASFAAKGSGSCVTNLGSGNTPIPDRCSCPVDSLLLNLNLDEFTFRNKLFRGMFNFQLCIRMPKVKTKPCPKSGGLGIDRTYTS